jgi:hypothetical protein
MGRLVIIFVVIPFIANAVESPLSVGSFNSLPFTKTLFYVMVHKESGFSFAAFLRKKGKTSSMRILLPVCG